MRTRSNTRCVLAALFFASLCTASTALGNGRFPRAQRLLESPSDPNRLTLAATYGLLTTSDRGKNWYHVCEAAFSFDDMYTGDPVLDLTADESLLAGVQGALTISHDHGCQWAPVLQASNQAIIDFSISRSNRNDAIVLVTIYGDGGAPVHRLQESTDGGTNWKLIGAPLPAAAVYTVDIDPKDPMHIIATGLSGLTETGTGLFLSSADHGAHWTSTMIPGTNPDHVPYIAGIHPTDPQKIFVRTDAWKDRDIVDTADDALLYSSDGGQSWKEILHPGAGDMPGVKLYGFALSPDGTTALAGYGTPVEGAQVVDEMLMGVYKSSGPDYAFGDKMFDGAISCITWTSNGVYVCVLSQQQSEPSYLGFAPDANFTSAPCSLAPIMRLNEVKGVPPGCTGRAATSCDWAGKDCLTLDACNGVMSDAGVCPTSGAATTGTGGASGGGVTSGSGGGGAGQAGGSPQSGCGCRVPRAGTVSRPWALLLLAAALAARRRRADARLNFRGHSR